jgi:hypothetical protein
MLFHSEFWELSAMEGYSKMRWIFVGFTRAGLLGLWAASALPTAFAAISWDTCTTDAYVLSLTYTRILSSS